MKVADELARAVEALSEAGIGTARHDAEWLLATVLGRRRGALIDRPDQEFTDGALGAFRELLARRLKREPLAYVIGTVGFRGLELEVGPGVLVPRPETEITAERAVARARVRGRRPTVVDVGTGCGAIALSLAVELPDARIFATEASGAARGWALRNLARTGLRCTLLPGDLLSPLHPALGGAVDVVVSNPPYVSDEEWETLEDEVRVFEPRDAVVGGPTGLEVILELLEQVRMWLAPGGAIVIEIAPSQAAKVRRLLEIIGYEDATVTKDLTGRDRVVEATWTGAP